MTVDAQSIDVEFDHTSPVYARSWREIYADLRLRCPVARSPVYGVDTIGDGGMMPP